MQLQIGNKIKVKKHLKVNDSFDGVTFTSGMSPLRGRIVEITETTFNGRHYRIKESSFYWAIEMFELNKINYYEIY